MPGLDLYGLGRAQVTTGPATATDQAADATVAAFSPGATVKTSTGRNVLHPSHPFGLAVWVGVGSIVVLALVRHSLPR